MILFLATSSTIQGQKGDKGAPGENVTGETGQKGDKGCPGDLRSADGKLLMPIFIQFIINNKVQFCAEKTFAVTF